MGEWLETLQKNSVSSLSDAQVSRRIKIVPNLPGLDQALHLLHSLGAASGLMTITRESLSITSEIFNSSPK